MIFLQPGFILGAAIDIPAGRISNKMSLVFTTISLLIPSSNYHWCVNHKSVLCMVNHCHCHHWLSATFCWEVNSAHSHLLHVLSVQCTSYFQVGQAPTYTYMETCANMLTVKHTGCRTYWISGRQSKHTFTNLSPPSQGLYQPRSAVLSHHVFK